MALGDSNDPMMQEKSQKRSAEIPPALFSFAKNRSILPRFFFQATYSVSD